ncbi:hypothetical protein XENOCAPTIV_001676, partial [Xenoophorus captivus]
GHFIILSEVSVHPVIPVFIISRMVSCFAASSSYVLGAQDPHAHLEVCLLDTKLHRVHQVIDVVQGPHG